MWKLGIYYSSFSTSKFSTIWSTREEKGHIDGVSMQSKTQFSFNKAKHVEISIMLNMWHLGSFTRQHFNIACISLF
jgi:hypothetical protein